MTNRTRYFGNYAYWLKGVYSNRTDAITHQVRYQAKGYKARIIKRGSGKFELWSDYPPYKEV